MLKNTAILLTLLLTLIITSCSSFKSRNPASERDNTLAQFYKEVYAANQFVGKDSLNCHKAYDEIYKKLFNIAGVSSYFDTSDLKTIDEDIQSSFETRIALKESFQRFNLETEDDQLCFNSAQDAFRSIRYVEDYLVELRMEKANASPSEYVSLKGEFPYFLINPKFANEFKSYEDLKSGDVILSRGNAYSSAAIARIALSDYQFSHLSFVYKDPETKELFTSEAHIEIGSITSTIADHIDEKNSRSAVFRHKDQALAHKASKAIYDKVKSRQEMGKNIEYDFSMNYKDSSKLFCSEIISHGFKMVEPERDYLPKFKSKFSKGMIPFLNTIGIPVNLDNIKSLDVFAPGDVQFDPDFELVAEWRNPKKSEESRLKDFILTKLFERMDSEGYEIDPSFKIDAESKALWLLRRVPIIKKFLEKKFSLNMNPAQLNLFVTLDKIGEAIYKNLELRSIDYDHPMTPKEIYAAIDEFIKKDKEQYLLYKKNNDVEKPAFHLFFHP